MRFALGVATVLVLAFAVPVGASTASILRDDCNPPCGPIPVIITILLEKSKGLTFEDGGFESTGVVQYYYDITQNGYAYDPTKEMTVTLKVNKQPPWVSTSLEPMKYTVPLRPEECPDCVYQVGTTEQFYYQHEHPVSVKVEKLRDPTPEELVKWTKSDKTYRATFSAVSPDSMVGTDPTGRPAGLMEGYGIKELRFLASAESAAAAGSGAEPQGLAPGPGPMALGAVVLAVVVAIAIRRRT